VRVCVCGRACVYVCMCSLFVCDMNSFICVSVCVCFCVCVYICIYMCMCVYVCVCVSYIRVVPYIRRRSGHTLKCCTHLSESRTPETELMARLTFIRVAYLSESRIYESHIRVKYVSELLIYASHIRMSHVYTSQICE